MPRYQPRPAVLDPIETASTDELRALQQTRLRATLRHAYDNVIHYRTAFDAAGLHPDDLTSLDQLPQLPFTTNEDLRRHYPCGMFAVPRDQIARIHASSGTRNQASIDAEAGLDGIYVIRTSVSADTLDPTDVVLAYKNLSHVERDWRNIKADDLDLRPIHHWLEDRVKAHVLICMLAQYLVWHLRHALAPLTYTDEQPPSRDSPVAPAQRSAAATRKTSRHANEHDQPLYSFRGLLTHLGTLTRNEVRYGRDDNAPVVPTMAASTPTQRRAFELLGTTVPVTLP